MLCPWTPEKSPEQKGPEHEMQTTVSSVLFFQAYKVHPSILKNLGFNKDRLTPICIVSLIPHRSTGNV